MWLSGLGIVLPTKRSRVPFPVRAHAWVVGQVPGWLGVRRSNQSMFLSHITISLPLLLPPPPSLSKTKRKQNRNQDQRGMVQTEGNRKRSESLLEGKNSTSRLWTLYLHRMDLKTGKGVEGKEIPLWMHRNLFEMNSVNSYMQGACKNLQGNKNPLKRSCDIAEFVGSL